MNPWNEKPTEMVRVEGGELAYYSFGRGPDLVLLHGWPLHAATFRRLVPLLLPHFTLHLFDFPGTGRTVWRSELNFSCIAPALLSALASLKLEAYVVFGHDSGGAVARHVAAQATQVRGLILEDTEIPNHRSALLLALIAACNLPFADRMLPWAMTKGPFRRSVFGFGSCFKDPSYADGEFADLFAAPFRDPNVARSQMTIAQTFDLKWIDALAAVHANIRVPTQCIWGENDPYFPAIPARAMLTQFAGPTAFSVIPNARLLPHEDHPNEVASLIRTFVDGLGAR
jgi:haloalkane dehalogenase